jgi:4-hydroxybenzoate polyprenyltransferase
MGINKKYWLKRKPDGSGWVPTRQGWSLIIALIALAIVWAWVLRDTPRNTFSIPLLLYIVYVVSLIVAIVWLSLKKHKDV